MPAPLRLPRDTVSPEVSECSRIPSSRRPLSTEMRACPPSCAIVIAFRVRCQARGFSTTTSAATALAATVQTGGTGWVPASRSQNTDIPDRLGAATSVRLNDQDSFSEGTERSRGDSPGPAAPDVPGKPHPCANTWWRYVYVRKAIGAGSGDI